MTEPRREHGVTAAKDIADGHFLYWVGRHNDAECDCQEWRRTAGHWALWSDMQEAFPEYPPKVVLAKARQLIKRGLVDGCGCGCRGDFRLTDKGREVLVASTPT